MSLTESLTLTRAPPSRTLAILFAGQGLVALAAWSLAGATALPKPLEVGRALLSLWENEALARELLTSLTTSLEALGLAAAISFAIAWSSVLPALRPLAVLVASGRFLGLAGMTFVLTLLVGGGHTLKVALLVAGMTPFLASGLVAEVAAIPERRFEYARTLRLTEWRVWWEVVVLGTLDRALEMIRQNAAIAWTLLSLVEGLVRSEGGVGALLLNQTRHLHLAEIFALQLSILFVGLIQDRALGALRPALCPHTRRR